MCGIVGIASINAVTNHDWLARARTAMSHRGPDDSGERWLAQDRVGLGHLRLSIIDLSPAGHQPMSDSDDELTIVFNGEIYNFLDLRIELKSKGHTFVSQSDTEVLLAAYREWGDECISHLNGMFAFAIYDARQQVLFLARDRAGEKPLFFCHSDGALRFASELKGLMADPEVPRRIDPTALDCYLTLGYIPGELCILAGVKKLPPAHALKFRLDTGEAKLWRYWRLPEFNGSETNNHKNEEDLLGELQTLLQDSVRRQLVADVPIGVLLSGGVDSSLITALAAHTLPKLMTFTVSFPGFGAYDESAHARLIADHFETQHIELDANDVSPDLLPLLARQFDEPISDSSMIPTYLVSQVVRKHCTVVLGGDGGDELFGGYGHYSRLLWRQEKLGFLPSLIRLPTSKAAQTFLPIGFRGRNWLLTLAVDLRHGLPFPGTHFDPRSRRRLISRDRGQEPVAETVFAERVSNAPDLLQRATRTDFENYLAEDILVKVDRASMLNSLEVRAPFLDYRLVEFAFKCIPANLKATSASRKVLLKRLAARLLPPGFDYDRKQGFSIPLDKWLAKPQWKELFHDVLLGTGSGLFSKEFVQSLFNSAQGNRMQSERLFSLALFELWRQTYEVSF